MKFTIPTYLTLLQVACLATALTLPIKEKGIAIHDQNNMATSESFSGANTTDPEPEMRPTYITMF